MASQMGHILRKQPPRNKIHFQRHQIDLCLVRHEKCFGFILNIILPLIWIWVIRNVSKSSACQPKKGPLYVRWPNHRIIRILWLCLFCWGLSSFFLGGSQVVTDCQHLRVMHFFSTYILFLKCFNCRTLCSSIFYPLILCSLLTINAADQWIVTITAAN